MIFICNFSSFILIFFLILFKNFIIEIFYKNLNYCFIKYNFFNIIYFIFSIFEIIKLKIIFQSF